MMGIPINQIICGRNEVVMADWPDDCIDLTVTSPPYDGLRTYKGYTWDFEATARQLYRVTKPGGVVVWVVADATVDGSETGTSFRQALRFMEIGFKLHDTMIYAKQSFVPLTHNRYEQQFEYMFVLSKGRLSTFNPIMVPSLHMITREGRFNGHKKRNGNQETSDIKQTKEVKIPGNIFAYPLGFGRTTRDMQGKVEHVAPFPEKLAEDHILSWSNPDDIVLDPFVGSGTTLKMAIKHHRQFIGVDISEEYCALARRRIGAVQPTLFELSEAR